jgi:hypothetical protein
VDEFSREEILGRKCMLSDKGIYMLLTVRHIQF